MFAVAGVTGNTGKIVAHTLLSQGKKVRVIVRDAAKAKEFADKGAEVAVADLGDAEALTRALTGASGAYLLVPPAMVANFKEYQLRTGAAVTDAVAKSKVPHVVFLSSIGADLPSGNGPIEALYQIEASLRQIPTTKATFLRAGYFIENIGGSLGALAQGVLPGFFPLDLKIPFVATKDIGEIAARLLVEGPFAGVVEVSSQVGTWSDAAAALSKLTGKTVTPQAAPLEAMIPTLKSFGFSDELAGMYHSMTGSIIAGKITWGQGQRHIKGDTTIEAVLGGLLQRS